jgi:hypothetical protein
MDLNPRRRTFEQAVALQIAQELTRALGPILPEALATANETVCGIFADAFDRNEVTNEAAAARILGYVPKFLVDLNSQFAELNARLDAAIRQPIRAGSLR